MSGRKVTKATHAREVLMTAVEAGAAPQYESFRWTTGSVLRTRLDLHVPEATPHHLRRERLSGLLASSTAPLALLSAPAGAGKTALAAEWAHRLGGARDVVWVRCHRGDADPWGDVLRGMGRAEARDSEAGGSLRRQGFDRSQLELVLETAARSSLPWTVFLDGYDVRSADAGEGLDHLLTHAGRGLQVVLSTRVDPLLPLHRYRLDGDLLEVRAADLAFTDAEAELMMRAGGVDLDPKDLHALNARLGGWAAGLRFALPTLARRPALHALVSSAATYNGNINAYLVQEVLDAQPATLRDLILTTSVPDTLTPGLLEELTGEPAAPTMLRLMRANVFLESTAGDESCLRYVPFFRDLVRAQLAYEAPERFHQLRRTVAAWYAAQGKRVVAATATRQRLPVSCATGLDGRVVEPLTPREVEVLAAMSEWLTTEEIAEELFVSVNTVRTHVRNILTKLGVSRRNAAIREAIRLGVLTPGPRVLRSPALAGPT